MNLAEVAIIFTFVLLAVLSALSAVALLIRESFVSASLIDEQFEHFIK